MHTHATLGIVSPLQKRAVVKDVFWCQLKDRHVLEDRGMVSLEVVEYLECEAA